MAIEQQISSFGNLWLATKYKQELSDIIARIISDRKESPISNVVCLAIGGQHDSPNHPSDVQQFVILLQILTELGAANSSLLNNIVAQDPDMTFEWRAVFKNRGIKVVEDPDAFKLIGPNTLLVAPFMLEDILAERMKDHSGEVGMYFGNGKWLSKMSHRYLEYPDEAWWAPDVDRAVLCSMFDEKVCKHEDLPCHKSNSRTPIRDSKMKGLLLLDIWWRPTSQDFDSSRS